MKLFGWGTGVCLIK